MLASLLNRVKGENCTVVCRSYQSTYLIYLVLMVSNTIVFESYRFVIETCRQLREKKSYMVYTAVGCLGVSALSDLINEVILLQLYLI